MAEFYSGLSENNRRSCGGLLLRRSHTFHSQNASMPIEWTRLQLVSSHNYGKRCAAPTFRDGA